MIEEEKKMRKNIYKMFENFYEYDSIKNMTVEEAKDILRPFLNDFIYLYEQHVSVENDWRSGEETYGYDEGTILNNLFYISDRWECAFRIRWIIDMLDPFHFT